MLTRQKVYASDISIIPLFPLTTEHQYNVWNVKDKCSIMINNQKVIKRHCKSYLYITLTTAF